MAGVKASGPVGYALQFYTVISATNCEKTRHNVWVKWKRVLFSSSFASEEENSVCHDISKLCCKGLDYRGTTSTKIPKLTLLV